MRAQVESANGGRSAVPEVQVCILGQGKTMNSTTNTKGETMTDDVMVIRLKRCATGFVAAHYSDVEGTFPSQSIIDLFGTHVLPTPFTASASPTAVWSE